MAKHEKISTACMLAFRILKVGNGSTHHYQRSSARGVMINSNINIGPPLLEPAGSICWSGPA